MIELDETNEERVDNEANPFMRWKGNKSIYETIKKVVNGLILFPLRVILILLLAPIVYFVARLSTVGLSQEYLNNFPLTGWRANARSSLAFFARVFLFILGFYWIKVKGTPAKPEQAPILVSNHFSFVEGILLFALHAPIMVSKNENLKIPLVGALLQATQAILVDKDDPNSKKTTLNTLKTRASGVIIVDQFEMEDTAADPLREATQIWPQIVIFPEGTCTNGRALISWKHDGFYPGLPVQPVFIRFPFRYFDVSYLPGTSLGPLMFQLMCQFINYMEVEYLDVYVPDSLEQKDSKLFAENVRKKVSRHLGVPVTNHTYEDVLLMQTAVALQEPESTVDISVQRIKDLLNIDVQSAQELMKRFAEMDSNNDGKVDQVEFARGLHMPENSSLAAQLFQLFDIDDYGSIHFREFIAGLSLLNNSSEEGGERSIKLVFQVIDTNGDGKLQKNELGDMLRMCFTGITEGEISQVFKSMDTDHDQQISYDEFLAYIRKNKKRSVLLSQVLKPVSNAVQGHSSKNSEIKPAKIPLTESKLQILVEEL